MRNYREGKRADSKPPVCVHNLDPDVMNAGRDFDIGQVNASRVDKPIHTSGQIDEWLLQICYFNRIRVDLRSSVALENQLEFERRLHCPSFGRRRQQAYSRFACQGSRARFRSTGKTPIGQRRLSWRE